MREGGDLFREGRFSDARSRFEGALGIAGFLGDTASAVRALGNIGGCQFASLQYQSALRSYVHAHRLAEQAGDADAAAVLDANIASLYAQTGEVDSAIEWLRDSLVRMRGELRQQHLPKVQIEMAALYARQEKWEPAFDLFHQGLTGAMRRRDWGLYSTGWSRMGEELLRHDQLPEAERALLEAYRVRKLHHLALDTSYTNLGKLRLEQGHLAEASLLLDRAVDLARDPHGPMPVWHVFLSRGRVRMAQGRLQDAMEDLRVALRLARAWRWSAPAADATQVGSEKVLDDVYSALIEAGNRLYLETHDPALVRETFEAAEENRANSLRQLVTGRRRGPDDLPPAYSETMARLQRAEIAALRSDDPATQETVLKTRADLVRMEAAFLPDSRPAEGNLLHQLRGRLDQDTALMGFHLGAARSWLWALDRDELDVYALPGREQIASLAAEATRAIRDDTPDAGIRSAELYRVLFGSLAPRFETKSHWLLALDRQLFEVPVAALIETTRPAPVYVAERHVVESIPGAGYWLESASPPERRTDRLFLGIGDPIYNSADPRTPHFSVMQAGLLPTGGFFNSAPAGNSVVLPRLVGSGTELEACARAWDGQHILLRGTEANGKRLTQELKRNPEVLHIAAHFLESSGEPSVELIALGLTDRREPEMLSPTEISHWRLRIRLVALSGCHSGAGAELPGTGLLGLTRAWLTAGAQSVLATRWEIPDDRGELFRSLYHALAHQSGSRAAAALQHAQLEMLRAGGRRSRPSYWGAYFVVSGQ